MKKLNEITIADLMPDSISGDAQVSATARAIDPQLRLISEAVDKPIILAAIDDLSAGVLEHLAVQYDVTAWDSAWPIETKRAVLKTAIADKRKMGTRGAVQRAIEAVAPIATITEWWQDTSGEMSPHTFKIDLLQEESAVDSETQANVIAQVNESKPVRSHYTFTAIQQAGSGFYFAGVLRAISYARVRSAGISFEQTSINAGALAALRGMNIRRLLASSHMGEMPEPVVPDSALFGGNFTTGDEISTDSVAGGQGYLTDYTISRPLIQLLGFNEGGYILRHSGTRSRIDLVGWNGGGNLNVGYLMSDAIENPQDYNVDYEETNRLYGASGSRIAYSDTSIEYKILCAERLGSLWNNADLAWLNLKQFQGNLCAQSGSYEDMPANTDLYSLMYSRKQNPIIIDLKLSSNIPVTFSSNDYWYSMFRSASDQAKAEQYGMTVYNNQLDDDNLSTYDISILALLDSNGDAVSADLSNFYVGSGNGNVRICNYTAFLTPTAFWRVYISKKNEPKSIELLLGLRYDGNDWLSKTFDADDFWWSGIMSKQDKALVEAIGLSTDVQLYQFGGPIGTILYDSKYKYEILGLYSDLAGTQEVQADLNNFYVGPHRTSSQEGPYACICNYAAFNTPSMTWKVRITRIGESILAYKADGTTSQGAKIGSQYKVDAVDNGLHSEADLNAIGWYVTWRLYNNGSLNLNIRDATSLNYSTVIAVWPSGVELVGNPYLEQTVDGRTWQTVKFSTDGGTTVQTGYCIVDSQVPVTYTTGIAETDVLLANTP